jgi:hypothetical protein
MIFRASFPAVFGQSANMALKGTTQENVHFHARTHSDIRPTPVWS